MWEDRNEFVHEQEDTKQKDTLEQVNRMIEKEYETKGIGLPEKEQRMFSRPLRSILKSRRNYKRNWLGRLFAAQACVRRRIGILAGEEVEDRYKNERKLIHTWRGSQKRRKSMNARQTRKEKKQKVEVNTSNDEIE